MVKLEDMELKLEKKKKNVVILLFISTRFNDLIINNE